MTDSVSKQRLIAAIDQVREALKVVEPTCDLLYSVSGDGYSLGQNQGAQQCLDKLSQALQDGFYDEELDEMDIEVLFLYDEEDLDTDTAESYPDDEGQQDDLLNGGIVVLDPNTTPEEREELTEFYATLGLKVQ